MPSFGRTLSEIPPSPLVAVEQLLRKHAHPAPIALHQGKTFFEPCARPHDWDPTDFGIAAHQHAAPGGVADLRSAVAESVSARRGSSVSPSQVLVTSGATHGIALVLHALLRPGDEVLILSPQWLFATGLVLAAGGIPREVPVFVELSADPSFDFVSAIDRSVGPRTRAIYFNNPNNPTGFRLDEAAVSSLVDLAEWHDLWLVADNAYENYDFSPDGFVDTATIGNAADRTFSVHSCSKTYAMPGARVGYLVSPAGTDEVLTKWSLNTVYSVSTASQHAAFEALRTPIGELADRRRRVAQVWQMVDRELEVPHTAVAGGLYTFLDISACADPDSFYDVCARAGVGLAPGQAFGQRCRTWARVCFTAAPPDAVADAVGRVNKAYWEARDDH